MNRLDKKDGLIGLLLLLNLALMLAWWLQNKMPPINGDRPRNFLVKELQMTDKQQLTYDSLIEIHRSQRKEIGHQTKLLKEQLAQQIASADTLRVGRIAQQIGDLQVQLEKMNVGHFRAIRTLCDSTQKKKFDLVIREMLKMMGGGNQPPRGGLPPRP